MEGTGLETGTSWDGAVVPVSRRSCAHCVGAGHIPKLPISLHKTVGSCMPTEVQPRWPWVGRREGHLLGNSLPTAQILAQTPCGPPELLLFSCACHGSIQYSPHTANNLVSTSSTAVSALVLNHRVLGVGKPGLEMEEKPGSTENLKTTYMVESDHVYGKSLLWGALRVMLTPAQQEPEPRAYLGSMGIQRVLFGVSK